jgi:cytoskeletal protein RodZ
MRPVITDCIIDHYAEVRKELDTFDQAVYARTIYQKTCFPFVTERASRLVLMEAFALASVHLKGRAMSETLVIIAISIIIAGFLILAGVALWLAMERRKHLAPEHPPAPKSSTAERPAPRPEVVSPASAEPAPVKEAASVAPAAKTPAPERDITHSAEYPQAGKYDQTWIPNQPRMSKRTKTQEPG